MEPRRVNPIRLIDSIYEWQTGTSLVVALAIGVFFVVGAVTFMRSAARLVLRSWRSAWIGSRARRDRGAFSW